MLREKFNHSRVFHASQEGTPSIETLLVQFTSGGLNPKDVQNGAVDAPFAMPLEQDLTDMYDLKTRNAVRFKQLQELQMESKKQSVESAVNAASVKAADPAE